MINFKLIYKILGSLLYLEAALMFLCLLLALYFEEDDTFTYIVTIPVVILGAIGLKCAGRGADNTLSRRDSFLVVTLTWVVFSLFGMLPFLVGGYIRNFTDAFFESMAGFTTTGATIIDDVEALPHGILFWRSLTQWIGGLGIVFFTTALLPSLVGGSTQVFAAESTGPVRTKLHPKLSMSAKWIWIVYLTITLGCMGSYMLCGMNWWEGINYSMTTAATGGFSIHNSSIEHFHSPAMDYVTVVFCFLSGVSFALLYFSAAKLRLKELWNNSELRLYMLLVLLFTLFVMVQLIAYNGYDLEPAFRSALFQVVSFLTTTGLFNDDVAMWPHATWVVLLVCMFVGSCSGSTSSGLKCVRVVMLLKMVRNELRQRLHPNAVLPLRINNSNISLQQRSSLLAFLTANLLILLFTAFVMILMGIDNTNAITISLGALNNVGPTLGLEMGDAMSWSALPALAKWLCALMMLIGRLEIFTVIVIFTPSFWNRV